MVTVNGSEQELTEMRGSWYRRAVVAQRVVAIAFLIPFVAVVGTAVAGIATGLLQPLLYLCFGVGIAGGVLAWAVVAVLAVRQARRPGGRFDPAELVPLAARYFHDLLGLRS